MSMPSKLSPGDLSPMVDGFDWIYLKTYLSLWLDVSDDVLHIHAGMLLLVAAALVLRRAPWDWRPWLVVVVVEGANEAYDLLQTTYYTNEGNFPAAWHDFWMTLLWPTVILTTFRWLGERARRKTVPKQMDIDDSSPSTEDGDQRPGDRERA